MTNNVAVALPRVALRIGSGRLTTGSGGSFRHISPITGEYQGDVPLAGSSEVASAVEAAAEAFPSWRATPPSQRRDLLLRLADGISERLDELSTINALETGTPVSLGNFLVSGTREWILYYAGWADKLEGTVHNVVPDSGNFAFSHSEPYGVIGVIFPWNNPIASIGMKVIPALAAGNTVVIKPSEFAPFAVELFAQISDEVGFPPGVINVVPGTGEAGNALVSHPSVQKISFTGGPDTGRRIMETCARYLKPSVMELGGKSPNLVFEDADLDRAAAQVIRSLGILAGQACVLGSRVLVQDTIYDVFVEKLAALTRGITPGDPTDPSTGYGPVISEHAQDRILGVIQSTVETGGGRLVTGGGKIDGALQNGFYLEPTIVADVGLDAEISQKETFGPVLSVYRFKTEDEAVEIANSTSFALGAYVQTSNVARALRLAGRLHSGGVYINGGPSVAPNLPFGGIGESGFGREGGKAGIEEFVRIKTVSVGAAV